MAMAERLCARAGGSLGISCEGGVITRPSSHRDPCFVKGLGGRALPIVGLRLGQQHGTRGGAGRRAKRGKRGKTAVKCVAQPVHEEALPEPTQLTQYKDSWIEVRVIEFLSDRIADVCGKRTVLKGYDGFVDITRKFVNGVPSRQQRDKIIELLHVVLPQWFLFFFRIVPKTDGVKNFYAKFTLVFFKWLVGDCEVREREIDGVNLKSTVYIKKCRYLEQSQCVGLCVNLCKHPTQEFIREQFGMPLTMNPNFEDMSCEMIYGLHPPPIEKDAAYQQPCYALCKTAKSKKSNCA